MPTITLLLLKQVASVHHIALLEVGLTRLFLWKKWCWISSANFYGPIRGGVDPTFFVEEMALDIQRQFFRPY